MPGDCKVPLQSEDEALKPTLRQLFSARRRSDRRSYWVVNLCLTPAYLALWAFTGFLGKNPVVVAVAIPFLWAWIAVFLCNNVRRLHDIGRSGWWQLVLFPIGMIPGALIAVLDPYSRALAFAWIAFIYLMEIGLWITLGSIRGDPEVNRFGPPTATTQSIAVAA